MAKPIKETPVLKGKDASEFTKRANNVKPVSQDEKKRMRDNYDKFYSRIKFI